MVASLPNPKVGAIIVAAGASSRMGDAGDKTLADLAGEPLIARTVDVFERCGAVECVALVVSKRNRAAVAAIREEKGWRKTMPPVLGGARRRDSVRAGLEALPKDCGWIVVHDGARPFVTPAMIEAGLEAARPTGAAVAVVPAFDTVKRIAPDGSVAKTLDRDELRMAQTPQVFRRDILERAHAEITDDATDDAAMAERIGVEVRTFDGARENIKITTAEDLGLEGAWVRVTYPLMDPIMNEVLVASEFAKEHERAFSMIDEALGQISEGFRMMPRHRKDEDAQTWSMLLGMGAFKSLLSARILLVRGYYEQALAICRTAMEHTAVEYGLSLLGVEKKNEVLRKLQNKDRFESRGEIGDILKQLQDSGIIDTSGWKTHYARFNEHVHVSGAKDQLVKTDDGVYIPFLYYSPEKTLNVLYHISGLLVQLMDNIYRVNRAEGIVWGDLTIRNALIDLNEELYQEHERTAGKEEYIIRC